MASNRLAVIQTHPVQYHAPIYRTLQQDLQLPVTAIYGSDFSVVGYRDSEFNTSFAWDTDLLNGYSSIFLSKAAAGATQTIERLKTRGLSGALRKLDPAAVLICGYSPSFHQLAFCKSWIQKTPLMFRAEATDYAQKRNRASQLVKDLILKTYYRRFAALLYIGKQAWEHYLRLGCAPAKMFSSPYCIDASSFQHGESQRKILRPVVRKELKIPSDKIVVLFSGKFVDKKDPLLLLNALKLLDEEQRKQIAVIFMGDGPLRNQMTSLAKSISKLEVRFIGFQNQSKLSRYYHGSDLLILPSKCNETWGLVTNEALHHGLPCVVSDQVGCGPDLVVAGETGEIFRAEDARDLAAAVLKVAQLTKRLAIRQRCRDRVASYSVKEAALGILAAYENVTTHRRRNG